MTRQPLEVNEVLQEVLKLVRQRLVGHGVAVETILAEGLPRYPATAFSFNRC